MIKIYNTFSKKKEIIDVKKMIGMYVCGATVYDNCHIGHARIFIFFDIVLRYFNFLNLNVNYIRNITDIDDKIIEKSYKINKPFHEMTKFYIDKMHKECKLLNIIKPHHEPHVTHHINDIIDFIKKLIDLKYAYKKNCDVYFKVERFVNYGKLSNLKKNFLKNNIYNIKKNNKDFVLWKSKKSNIEPYWNSPWGKGRPGWHIECSTLIEKYLGNDLYIHGGGTDLIFPHHENEIAQSEALINKKLSKIWMHVGHVTINKKKMSKSLLNDIKIDKYLNLHSPESLRYFFLMTHYRKPINFDYQKIYLIEKLIKKIFLIFDKKKEELNHIKEYIILEKYKKEFLLYMNDDFNTPQIIFLLNKMLKYYFKNQKNNFYSLKILNTIKYILKILGFPLKKSSETISLTKKEIEKLIYIRNIARKNKEWKKADHIRDILKKNSINIVDDKI